MRFENKVVFITGAAKGIGKAISQGFAEEGALLALSDLDIDELERTAKELSNVAKVIKTYKLDVTKEIMVEKVIEKVIKDFQKIDILINNAGVSTMNYFWDLTEEEWDFNMNVNAKGVWLVSKYVVPYMIKEKKGK
nr:SDR family NAD(P)-dependent oxidoreductase [Thermoanaerobacter wiegelii]